MRARGGVEVIKIIWTGLEVFGGAGGGARGPAERLECGVSITWMAAGEAAPKQIFVGGSDERLRGVREAARE